MYGKFENFDLEFSRAADGYVARVLSSPGGEGSHSFAVPVDDIELENVVLHVLAARNTRSISSKPGVRLRSVGGALFKSVFAGEVLQCYLQSLATSAGSGLRLRLRFAGTPELVNLPWELLYDEGVDQWVSLKYETPLVRYVRMPAQIAPLSVSGPLHVLTVVSNPSDVPSLDVESEVTAVEAALQSLNKLAAGSVVTQTLRHPTPESLQYKVMEMPWNVLHFIGHGEFDERTQMGRLVLEDEHGKARPITAERLSVMLQGRKIKLVVLNSCEGSKSGEDNRSGLTQSLIAQGVPAVIAMQFPITDLAALAFSKMFYRALVLGLSLENAVLEARRAIYQDSELEWATPTLYLRSESGQLFDIPDPGPDVRAALQTGSPVIEHDAVPIVPEKAALRAVPVDVVVEPIPIVRVDPIVVTPKPETTVPTPVLPWWKKPFAIPGAVFALVVILFGLSRLSPGPAPAPDPSPSPSAESTVAPTNEPLPTAFPTLGKNAIVTSSQLARLACPMKNATTRDTFISDTHLWGRLPVGISYDEGYLVLVPDKGKTARIESRGTMNDGSVCTSVSIDRTGPWPRAGDESAAGIVFWENRERFWALYVNSRGNARVQNYDLKKKTWTSVVDAPYTKHYDIYSSEIAILSVQLARGTASFYVNGARIGSASGGPSGATQSGLFASTDASEPNPLKWHFGAYGVAASK